MSNLEADGLQQQKPVLAHF